MKNGFYCSVDNDKDFLEIMEMLLSFKANLDVSTSLIIGNDIPLMMNKKRFLWNFLKRNAPIPENIRAGHGKKYAARNWVFTGVMQGTNQQTKTVQKTLRKAIYPAKITFLDAKKLEDQCFKTKALNANGLTSNRLTQSFDLPAAVESVRVAIDAIETIYHKYGFDCPMTFTTTNENSLNVVAQILFDPTNEFETSQAMLCHEEVNQGLIKTRPSDSKMNQPLY